MGEMPLDLEDLRSAVAAGWQPSFLFFWGHQSRSDTVDKHVLSQWWPARFILDDATFATAEHYMMAEKARLFRDEETRQRIIATPEPKEVKALGRKIRNFDERVWRQKRFDIVVRGNIAKFDQNSELGAWLRGTKEDVIVEASPVDAIWGIGLKSDDIRAAVPAQWRGLNLLGFALMKVRANIGGRR